MDSGMWKMVGDLGHIPESNHTCITIRLYGNA